MVHALEHLPPTCRPSVDHVAENIKHFVPPAPWERPILVELDSSHLLVVYAVGTDPGSTGTASTAKLRMAIARRGTAGELTPLPLLPLTAPYDTDVDLAQRRPSLARVGDDIFLAYESESPPSDAAGRETFLQRLAWSSSDPSTLVQAEERLLQDDAPTELDQQNPRLAATPLFPGGGLLSVWEEHGGVSPDRPDPDVLMSLEPLPVVTLLPPAPPEP